MTADEIMKELKGLGLESIKKVLRNHCIQEPFFGVKISELKKIQKRIKKDYQLSLDLFDTGNYDVQYLAGLIADESKMTKKDLQHWLAKANCTPICGFTVAWVTAESRYGHQLALEWIESKKEQTAQTGWATLSSLVSITDDSKLDLDELRQLLQCVEQTIQQQPNHVRSTMNGFVIAVGIYVRDLTDLAIQTGHRIGLVSVDMGNTACEVPSSPAYIQKAVDRGSIGKKRKTAKC